MLRALLFVLLATTTTTTKPPPAPDRMARLIELWGTVKFLHPESFSRAGEWDAALMAAAPRVRAARTTDEYSAAVTSMLQGLRDPATHVFRPADLTPPKPDARKDPKLLAELEGGKTVLVDLTALHGVQPTRDEARDIERQLAAARRVVVDMRVTGQDWDLDGLPFYGALASRQVQGPALRSVRHAGYRPQVGGSSGGYQSSLVVSLPERFRPPTGAAAKRVAFLVSKDGPVLPIALAVQAAGDGALVAEGALTDEAVVKQVAVDLGEGLAAVVRVQQLVGAELHADVTVPPGGDAMKAALAWLDSGRRARPHRSATPPAGGWAPDPTYDEPEHPDAAHRLLAVARFWSVIHFFYPYMALIGDDWDHTVLARFLPQVEAARDAQEYGLAIAEMSTFVPDGHTWVHSAALDSFFGVAQPPIAVRVIEGVPVVEEIHDPAAARAAGIAVGDVVLAVDGEPADQRMRRLGRYVSGSNQAAHQLYVAGRLLGGAEGSTALLSIRNAGGQVREVRLPRRWATAHPHRGGEVVKVLPGNVGYLDLDRLKSEDAAAALERLKETRGLVLDLRGYPHGTAWVLAPRLNVKQARWGAAFQRPLVGGATEEEGTRLSFLQALPPTQGWIYRKPVVTLIDERTISQAEHTGLFLEAACGTRFVGSPSAGANGDITSFMLPGAVRITFTGHDVRHADGRQLQRVGLQPHILVRPTITGVRAGRDEVLERALREIR